MSSRHGDLVLTFLLLAACTSFSPVTQNPSPVEGDSFRDIPVPREFNLLKQRRESFKYENTGEFKEGQLKYQGPETAANVVSFYQNQMILAGWEDQGVPRGSTKSGDTDFALPEEVSDGRQLFFSKGRYLAHIAIAETTRSTPESPESLVVIVLNTK
jgi:hypothetical protein